MSVEIAGYTINLRKRLGKGALGIVYTATDKDGSTVAAKEVDSARSERSALRELDNARKQKQLEHENIVKIFHIHNEEDIWVFMEHCCGGDLNTYSKTHYDQFQILKLEIMAQMTKGLEFLHGLRIAHRDIKPENTLIQSESETQGVVVKLTDFGLAKFIDPDDSTSAMETNVGTYQYKAPEFWDANPDDGKIKYHKDTDTYALGLTFLAMIQAKEGRHLKPVLEGCTEAEKKQPIGLLMLNRKNFGQKELEIIKVDQMDNAEVASIKQLIKNTTSINPADRPNATMILENIKRLQAGQSANMDLSESRTLGTLQKPPLPPKPHKNIPPPIKPKKVLPPGYQLALKLSEPNQARSAAAPQPASQLVTKGQYSWSPLCKDMHDWTDYITDCITNMDDNYYLERMCIMEVTGKRWITSDHSLRPTSEQLNKLCDAFNGIIDWIEIGTGTVRTFHVRENDGQMLEAVGGKHGAMNEILAAGMTRHYVILAGQIVKKDNGRCKFEVEFITKHLSSLGK